MHSRAKNKLRIGSWNVCGFAAQERKRLEIVEQVSNRDLDKYSGNSTVMGGRGGGGRMQSCRVRMGRAKEKGSE